MFPVLFMFILYGIERPFAILLCVNLVTDILDGLIARQFKLQTKFGAKLDSVADIGTYILAIFGLFWFKWQVIEPHAIYLYVFLATYLMGHLVSLIRFKTFPALHLVSIKVGAYMQGIFFFTLFMFEFNYWIYVIALVYGILSYIEEIVVLLVIKEMREDHRGLYWIFKKRRNG